MLWPTILTRKSSSSPPCPKMQHNILLTGASGYLGGSLLAEWSSAKLPPHGKLYALIRSDVQAAAVQKLGAEAIWLDTSNAESVRQCIVEHQITVVLWLINALRSEGQLALIHALAEVKRATGRDVYLIHVRITSLVDDAEKLLTSLRYPDERSEALL